MACHSKPQHGSQFDSFTWSRKPAKYVLLWIFGWWRRRMRSGVRLRTGVHGNKTFADQTDLIFSYILPNFWLCAIYLDKLQSFTLHKTAFNNGYRGLCYGRSNYNNRRVNQRNIDAGFITRGPCPGISPALIFLSCFVKQTAQTNLKWVRGHEILGSEFSCDSLEELMCEGGNTNSVTASSEWSSTHGVWRICLHTQRHDETYTRTYALRQIHELFPTLSILNVFLCTRNFFRVAHQ